MQTQLIKNKKAQRKELLAKRRMLSQEQKNEYSKQITERLLALASYKEAKVCMMYASMKDEFQTKDFIVEAIKAGKQICLPYVSDKQLKIMHATKINSLDELVEGAYGILTVAKDKLNIINPQDIDFVLVPAVGFDREGYRLGMGGGYYDRYLKMATKAKLVSGIYSCQLVDEIVKGDYDAQVDFVLTENETIQCK